MKLLSQPVEFLFSCLHILHITKDLLSCLVVIGLYLFHFCSDSLNDVCFSFSQLFDFHFIISLKLLLKFFHFDSSFLLFFNTNVCDLKISYSAQFIFNLLFASFVQVEFVFLKTLLIRLNSFQVFELFLTIRKVKST